MLLNKINPRILLVSGIAILVLSFSLRYFITDKILYKRVDFALLAALLAVLLLVLFNKHVQEKAKPANWISAILFAVLTMLIIGFRLGYLAWPA